jgi:hypothetical protein
MDYSSILNILKNPNPKTDFVQILSDIDANGDANFPNVPNDLTPIALARGLLLQDMNVVIVYLGSTIKATGNVNIGCTTTTQDIPNSPISADTLAKITTILTTPNPDTDLINLYTNNMSGLTKDTNYDFTMAKAPSGKCIPWKNMNIIFSSIKTMNGLGYKLNITFPCTNKPITPCPFDWSLFLTPKYMAGFAIICFTFLCIMMLICSMFMNM